MKTRLFPWKLYSKIVLGQLSMVVPTLLVVGVFFFYRLKSLPSGPVDKSHVEDFAVSLFIALFISLSLGFALSSSWVGWRLSQTFKAIVINLRKKGLQDVDMPEWVENTDVIEEQSDITQLEEDLQTMKKDLAISSEKASREVSELEILMSKITDAVLAVDKNGYPLFFNTRFALFFGEQNLDNKLSDIFSNEEVLVTFDTAIEKSVNESIVTKLERINKQEPRYFSLSVAPLVKKESDEVYGAIGIFHDITKLKRAEEIRIEFVSNVSHELRTPITSIKGYCDTLKSDIDQGQGTADEFNMYLDVITRNVNRLLSLVNDLLDLSSIESGETLEKESIKTVELTERVLRPLENKFNKKQQTIKTFYNAVNVQADSKRIEQVMINLVENAIKYVQPQGEISIYWDVGNDHSTLLRVKDNGPGISPSHLPRLFERFYRVDKARSRELGGTGLGLAIVKHIMQKHGGNIHVNSRLNEGTEFICNFPS